MLSLRRSLRRLAWDGFLWRVVINKLGVETILELDGEEAKVISQSRLLRVGNLGKDLHRY